jgi:hypothetical protein
MRAAATNEGAVLQWPWISFPIRDPMMALRPSTMEMRGRPGHSGRGAIVSTWANCRATGVDDERVTDRFDETTRRSTGLRRG